MQSTENVQNYVWNLENFCNQSKWQFFRQKYASFQLVRTHKKLQSKYFFSLLGGPGSGKGTQCDKICIKYGFTHLSSGDILRNEVMSGTPRGRQLYQMMSNGEPVPNEVVDDLLAEAMVKKAESKVIFFVVVIVNWVTCFRFANKVDFTENL